MGQDRRTSRSGKKKKKKLQGPACSSKTLGAEDRGRLEGAWGSREVRMSQLVVIRLSSLATLA